MSKVSNPTCHFCGKPETDEMYCYGCEHYVCEACNHRPAEAMGKYPVEDHEGDGDEEEA